MFKWSCEFNTTGNTLSKPRYALESMADLPLFTFKPISLDQDIEIYRAVGSGFEPAYDALDACITVTTTEVEWD